MNLRAPVEVGDWTIGPLDVFEGPWLNPDFEKRSREFLSKFQDADGRPIANPTLVWRGETGADGVAPSDAQDRGLQLALHLGLLDTNLPWREDLGGNSVATSDNSELFAWPLDVATGSIGTVRGGIVR